MRYANLDDLTASTTTDRRKKLNKKYTPWWWTVLVLFGIVELCALLDKDEGDTFTEHVRVWLSLQSRTAWAGRAFAVAFLGWLCWHFLYPK